MQPLASIAGRLPLQSLTATGVAASSDPGLKDALEVKETFSQFVGSTFFNRLIKSMRASVGKPAYLHGGRAEEIFRSQLDQILAEEVGQASAGRFTEPMFERQFPHLARQLAEADQKSVPDGPLEGLSQLSRR